MGNIKMVIVIRTSYEEILARHPQNEDEQLNRWAFLEEVSGGNYHER